MNHSMSDLPRPTLLSIVEGPVDYNDSRRILFMKGLPTAVARRNALTKVAAVVLASASLLCVIALVSSFFDNRGGAESSALAATPATQAAQLHSREPSESRSLATQTRVLSEAPKKAPATHAKRSTRKGWGPRGA